jgi:PAS domain S-box-containing protein
MKVQLEEESAIMIPKRILLVDDDLLGSSLTRDVLKSDGYDVAAVISGEKALARLEAEPAPDLVLMDIDLGPGRMDGTEAARRIMERADIPVVFLSAHSDAETITRARAAAKYGFVHKVPGNEMFLLATVEMALHLHETEARHRRDAESLRTFVEAIPEPAFLMQADGVLLMANAAFLGRFGRTAEEALGQDAFAWLPPDVAARRRARFDEAIASAAIVTYEDERDGRRLRNILYPIPGPSGQPDRVAVIGLDITEAHRRQEALSESEHLYRTLTEMLPDAVIKAGLDGGIQFANRAAAELHGFDDPAAMKGLSVFQLVAPGARPATDDRMRAGIEREGFVRTERTTLARRNGETFPAELGVFLIRNGEGRPESLIAVARDIEDRVRAEAELKKSRETLLEAQRVGGIGHWDFDPAAAAVEWSEETYRIFGLDPAGGIDQQRLLDAIHPEDRADFDGGGVEGRPRRADFRIIRPDGEVRFIHEEARAVHDDAGRLVRLHGTVQDVSDRKRVELRLRESESRIASLMANIPGLIYRCRNDRDWTMEFLSDGCLDLTGYEPAELLGQAAITYNDVILPEDRERVWTEVQAGLDAKRDFRTVYRIRKKSGEVRWVSERGRGLFGPDGGSTALEGIILDVTDRRLADERIEKGSQEKSILLKELQHRVKNNLAVISSLLNLESERLHDPRDREIFRMMRNRIRSMALIYERLYRSDDVRAVDARAYLEGLAKQLFESNQVRPGQVRLGLRFESFPLDLRKAVSCGLIFTELIANAMKHAFPGGRKGNLEVSAVRNGDGFVLAVRDDGVGFEAAAAGRESDGFGLKLVRSQADQMDGKLKIESNPGALFEIEVPII